jgi:hypothetical protein
VDRCKPRVQTPIVSRYPAPTPVHDFLLLFLPPCGPHLTLLATGSLESSLLVSPLLGGPARHRSFALALHLHQRKSSCNLHLQYSAKSQSTPRCQSLITARSDHPPVPECSSPHPPMTDTRGCSAPVSCCAASDTASLVAGSGLTLLSAAAPTVSQRSSSPCPTGSEEGMSCGTTSHTISNRVLTEGTRLH